MADNKLLGAGSLYFGSNEISKAYMGSNLVWEKAGETGIDYSKEYFYIENINGESMTVSIRTQSGEFKYIIIPKIIREERFNSSELIYLNWDHLDRIDGIIYGRFSRNISDIPLYSQGDRLIIFGSKEMLGYNSIANIFTFSDDVKVGGNIMSLTHGIDSDSGDGPVDPSTLPNKQFNNSSSTQQRQLYRLFKNQPVVDAENLVLSATTLGYSQCYAEMFQGCTSLIKAPKELPALTVRQQSYMNMFNGCTALTRAPLIKATELYMRACEQMFQGCSSLTQVPNLVIETISGTRACYRMFLDCSSLVYAPALPATTINSNCYQQMFASCTSLVTAPVLPATTLKSSCYSGMFYDCRSLVTAPVLPATTLTGSCYYQMFYGCTSLNYIKAMFTTTPGTYTQDWVYDVSSTGTFVKNSAAEWTDTGVNAVPEGWTVQTASS